MDDEQWLDGALVPALTFVDSHREAQSVGLLFAAWPGERARVDTPSPPDPVWTGSRSDKMSAAAL